MSYQKKIIHLEGKDAKSTVGSSNCMNPSEESVLKELYPISGFREPYKVIKAGKVVTAALNSTSPTKIYGFLEKFISNIEKLLNEHVHIVTPSRIIIHPGFSSADLPGLMLRFRVLCRHYNIFPNRVPEKACNNNLNGGFC